MRSTTKAPVQYRNPMANPHSVLRRISLEERAHIRRIQAGLPRS